MKLFRILIATLVALSLLLSPVASMAQAPTETVQFVTPIVDGVIDAEYGAPIASDTVGDGNGNAVMDLLDFYAAEDEENVYLAFTINEDLAVTNWGKYVIYIDTTNDANGATTDAWGRNVLVNDPHKPEFGIYTWTDNQPYDASATQFWAFANDSWSHVGSVPEAALGTGTTSALEFRISKTALGNPSDLYMEVWATGGGNNDNAQDTINDPANDWNASDWNTQAVLANSTHFAITPIETPPGAGHDDNIWWDHLGHNSRDTLYRTPGGPVPTGTEVLLRMRAAANDLTEAKVRLYNDRTDTQLILPMSIAHSDDTYDWWEVAVPASADETVWWYRFILIDGNKTVYYEDDAARTGGWGQPFDQSQDNSWQLTVYDAGFQTPDWIKNAVVYQVFPDRFRDGNPANNKPAGTFFYGEPGGTIYRSDTENWNTFICDPRANSNDACEGSWSKNFYGGDLQGLTDKLDYLQALGVTAIYLNPIFESPSNHGYDTTDYLSINEMFGTQADYDALIAGLQARGMHLIVDGVFNHVSSDSKYLDRYGRYDEVGACESPDSPYRDWFYFTDVPAGTGPCVGSDGTPNAANYESWWGYDSLPKLNSAHPEVRAWIWDNAANPEATVAGHWMQTADGWRLDVGADVDPGVLNDVNNDYWEGFRQTVRAVNPEGYITGEEWGIANSWLLGNEWDAVMNYQFSSAVLSLWRDSTFTDNDHNASSSAGELNPISMSQFDERIHNLMERYAPEALYAMLNLFGSHDTNRTLFMLDENTNTADPSIYLNPNYDWSPAIAKLKQATAIQMTMPGAPTVYYGDEVGLVGPVVKDGGGVWQDDPYNRQPYPWLDESGTPIYTHLQTAASQESTSTVFSALMNARKDHTSLQTGNYKTLLVDDTARHYAYLRNLPGEDVSVILVNRGVDAQINLNLAGLVPVGANFQKLLTADNYTINAEGSINNISVAANSVAILLLADSTLAAPPATILDLAATTNGTTVNLSWGAIADADEYLVYRSYLRGGGYEYLGTSTTASYTDSNLTSGTRYYYVVVAKNNTTLLESEYSNEVSALPAYTIGWANLQWPYSTTHTIGTTPTENIYGQVWIDGVTSQPGATPGLLAQVGYGPDGSDPRGNADWTWYNAAFNGQSGNNDEFVGTLLPETTGAFDYVYRYSTDGALSWVYAYRDGFIADPYDATRAGALTVNASQDVEAPSAPVLSIEDWSAASISLSWTDSIDDVEVYAYDLYRSTDGTTFTKLDRKLAPTTSYIDTTVTSGQTYYYYVVALDTSFNASQPSNTVSQTAEAKMVAVTFEVTVPYWTPGVVYIVGGHATVGNWNPGAVAMTKVSDTLWTYTASILDGTSFEFKFARGNWDTVMKGADGNEELANLPITIDYGTDGTQTYTYTVQNWRDPVVLEVVPVDQAVGRRPDTNILVTWSQAMSANTCLALEDADGTSIEGTCTLDDTGTQLTFDPATDLTPGETYTVSIADQIDVANDRQMVPFTSSFTVTTAPVLTYSNLTATSVDLEWTEITSPDVAFHRVWRSVNGTDFEMVAELDADVFTWTDTSLLGGRSYWYKVVAACASCAGIVESNIVEVATPARDIAVTFTAVVPDFTPGDVFLSYRLVGTEGWNYTQIKMNKIADLEWQWNGTLLEGKRYEFMISRGSAETEMRAADGNTLLTPIEYALEYHENGTLEIEAVVPNWRDPIVLSLSPAMREQAVAVDSVIEIVWSQAMPDGACPRVWSTTSGLDIVGSCSFDADTNTTTFTPDEKLPYGDHIVVEIVDLLDVVGDVQVIHVQSFFQTGFLYLYLPVIFR